MEAVNGSRKFSVPFIYMDLLWMLSSWSYAESPAMVQNSCLKECPYQSAQLGLTVRSFCYEPQVAS